MYAWSSTCLILSWCQACVISRQKATSSQGSLFRFPRVDNFNQMSG